MHHLLEERGENLLEKGSPLLLSVVDVGFDWLGLFCETVDDSHHEFAKGANENIGVQPTGNFQTSWTTYTSNSIFAGCH